MTGALPALPVVMAATAIAHGGRGVSLVPLVRDQLLMLSGFQRLSAPIALLALLCWRLAVVCVSGDPLGLLGQVKYSL